MNGQPEAPVPTGRTMWVLWWAFLFAPLMLFGVAALMSGIDPAAFYFTQGAAASPPLIGWVFLSISLTGLVVVPLVQPLILRSSSLDSGSMREAALAPGETVPGVTPMGRVFSAWIVSMAIAEAGALLGFVLSITTMNAANFVPALLIYVLLIVRLMPTRSLVDGWLSKVPDTRRTTV